MSDLVRSEVEAALETAMRGFERIKSSDLTMDGFTTFHGRLSMDEVGAFNDLFAFVHAGLSTPTEPDYEAATKAMTAKLKEHPIPAPSYGGTAGMAYFWGASVDEVARVAVDAALAGRVVVPTEGTTDD